MFTDRIEGKWIEAFQAVFGLCKIGSGEQVAILSETQSRAVNVHLAELALCGMGARPFHVVMPTPPQSTPVPVRSTGASEALQNNAAAVAALAQSTMVIDLTVEGLLHSPELPDILKGGARVLMISNEHPEVLERLKPDEDLKPRVREAVKRAKSARMLRVTSEAGSDLVADVSDCPVTGVWGWTDRPGTVTHWPGGIVVAFPGRQTVNGRLVMQVGDINLTFKRYLESPITLTVENDYVTRVEGTGLDAQLMREYYAAWNDREAFGVSHIGWGLNRNARHEALTLYDRHDINGTELRALAGNFLYSTGANEFAKRFTLGHFDLPMMGCTVSLDGVPVVENGQLVEV